MTINVVAPLRERLERAVADGAGDNEELANACAVCTANGRRSESTSTSTMWCAPRSSWALAAVVPGTRVCGWSTPRPSVPDAEDNALAGEVAAGQQFPTGHTCAPAHEGCRCMLALAPR